MRVLNAVAKAHTSVAWPAMLAPNKGNIPRTIASPGKRKGRHEGYLGPAHVRVAVNTKLTSKISAVFRILPV
jgi:hypothetical protein